MARKELCLLVGAFLAIVVTAGDDGDDFSNNLFTDLTPLLTLFGERVTTQFMSQSTGWADNIILAMAPLGILTIIVSAIRVGGPSWLKAIIGRARENRAVAESELMSSTSHEVCELWNGQAIVRVMGEGPIREFIILSRDRDGDGTKRDSINSSMSGSQVDEKTPVIDLGEAKKHGYLEECNPTIQERISGRFAQRHCDSPTPVVSEEEGSGETSQYDSAQPRPSLRERLLRRRILKGRDPEDATSDPHTRNAPQGSNREIPNASPAPVVSGVEHTLKDGPEIIVIRNTAVHTPNLILNIHNRVGKGELYAVAAFGLLLQLGTLVYFGIAAKYLTRKLLKDGNPVADYAFPCTAIGTVLLVAGTLTCAHVIESSTSEEQYRPTDGMTARAVWLQKSGTVNDQAFESFAVFPDDPQELLMTSQRAPRRKIKDLWRTDIVAQDASEQQPRKTMLRRLLEAEVVEVMTVTGTAVGVCGFIVQFIGLRGMHWSVSVTQLGAISIMTILRASVRRNLAKSPRSQALLSGHELDWLAMTLGDPGNAPWKDPPKHAGKWNKYDRPWADGSGWDWKIVAVKAVEDPTEVPKPRSDTSSTTTDESTGGEQFWENAIEESGGSMELPQVDENPRPHAHRVMRIRRDLGELAGWPGPASAEAISLARAIEVAMDSLFEDPDSMGGMFTWSIQTGQPGPGCEFIPFHVKRLDGRWKAYSDELEAALSLWLYSVHEWENPTQSARTEVQKESEKRTNSSENPKDDAWLRVKGTPARPSLQLLGPYTETLWRNLRWWIPNGASMVIGVNNSKGGDDRSTMEMEPHRVVGFASRSLADSHKTLYEQVLQKHSPQQTSLASLAVKSYNPLTTFYAQHMFSVFMRAAAKAMQPIPREAIIHPSGTDDATGPRTWQSFTLRDNQLSKMAQDIENTGLGSSEDIFLSVIPALSTEKKLPQANAVVELAREDAKPHEKRGNWSEAGNSYLWLWREAATCPIQGDIIMQAAALLMEFLRGITLIIKRDGPQFVEEKEIRLLESIKSNLENELNSVNVGDTFSALMGLHMVQRRGWNTGLVISSKNPEEDPKLKFSELHQAICSDKAHDVIEWRLARNGTNEKDIFHWTPLHYAVSKASYAALSALLEHRADVNAQDARGRTPLHYACEHGCIPFVQYLLMANAEINLKDTDGRTPLHDATIYGHREVAQSLIEAGAHLDAVDRFRGSPLHHAAYNGRIELIGLMDGANVKLRDRNGRTALHLAALAEDGSAMHLAVVRYLTTVANADKNANDRAGQTPLHLATRSSVDIVKYLIEEANIDKDVKDSAGHTPLHLAADSRMDIVKYLIEEANADKDAKENVEKTPLHIAASSRKDITKYLIEEANVDKEAKDKRGWTPLYYAVALRNMDVTKYLVEEVGADKEGRNNKGETPLHRACTFDKSIAMARYLVEAKADKDARDNKGRTPLHHACSRNGNIAIVGYLIEAGVDKHARDKEASTPLHHAAKNNKLHTIECLTGAGADADASDVDGRTPLHWAAAAYGGVAAEYLIKAGADKEKRDRGGHTPLHLAAEAGSNEVVECLLKSGADKEAKDGKGRTPLDIAEGRWKDSTAQLLH